jgi:hypothetical protein
MKLLRKKEHYLNNANNNRYQNTLKIKQVLLSDKTNAKL